MADDGKERWSDVRVPLIAVGIVVAIPAIATAIRDRLSISGRIVAIDVDPAGAPGRAVCVTREQEVQNGRGELGGGRHRVYLATLDQGPKGWGVSGWEPQP